MGPNYVPQHVHLVGSSPFASNTEFFERMTAALPDRVLNLPDGECGKRNYFVRWQLEIFADSPHILKGFQQIGDYKQHQSASHSANGIKMAPPGYDDYAIESYAEFCRLRKEGLIKKGVRFQVSLPTPANVIGLCLLPEYYAEAEAMYESALLAALRRIQDVIPAEDLAIQWDMAYEVGMLELPDAFTYCIDGLMMAGIVERVVRLTKNVDPGVKMGFHLCYGDSGHKHFMEPKDTGILVSLMNELSAAINRKIDWFHVPVPKSRTDEAYFAPLKDLKLKSETMIHLGLAHAWDLEGTQKRIQVARGILKTRDFGVATECGFGRTEEDELNSVLDVLAEVTQPKTYSVTEFYETAVAVGVATLLLGGLWVS